VARLKPMGKITIMVAILAIMAALAPTLIRVFQESSRVSDKDSSHSFSFFAIL
jgi:Tfp pilus assembly protein FimT